jgi:hypothetical protein
MIAYFLKTIVCSALLLAFYLVFLEKEKMHHFKRFYLLFSLVFPLAVPLVTLTIPAEVAPTSLLQPEQFIYTSTTANSSPLIAETVGAQNHNYFSFLSIIYGIVTIFLLCRFAIQLHRFFISLRQKERIRYGNSILVLTAEPAATHSFLQYIFISKDDYSKRDELVGLLTHELAHVIQRHSWDVVLVELLQAFWWFNPLLPFYRKAMRLNHEFLADEVALKQNTNVAGYQHMLLNTIQKETGLRLSSSVNFLLTKKRLIMMTKKTSNAATYFKQTTTFIAIASIVLLFSEKLVAQKQDERLSSKSIALEKKSDDLKDFVIVVEKTKNGIKMKSIKGSAWVDLTFSIINDRSQAIDEYGMAKLEDVSSDKDPLLADFLFTITKTENGIVLKGMEGTAWTNLSFSLSENGKQAINQFGMTNLN